MVYRSLAEDPANIYSLLLVAGYLKTPKKELQADGSYLCEVSIPNREIAAVYKSEILSHFLQTGAITRITANKIAESLYANDYKKLQSAIGEYMDNRGRFAVFSGNRYLIIRPQFEKIYQCFFGDIIPFVCRK